MENHAQELDGLGTFDFNAINPDPVMIPGPTNILPTENN
jgi:hypothetical protein